MLNGAKGDVDGKKINKNDFRVEINKLRLCPFSQTGLECREIFHLDAGRSRETEKFCDFLLLVINEEVSEKFLASCNTNFIVYNHIGLIFPYSPRFSASPVRLYIFMLRCTVQSIKLLKHLQ